MTETQTKERKIFIPSIRKIHGVDVTKLRGEKAQAIVGEVLQRAKKDYKNSPHFNGDYRHFTYNPELFDGEGGIEGSSLYFGIPIQRALEQEGSFLPNIRTGMTLDEKGELLNGVYRDYGLVVFSSQGMNEEVAKPLAEELKKRGYEFPVLVSFSDLDLDDKGLEIKLKEDTSGLITGEEARKEFERLKYVGNSGVRRLSRDEDGSWDASWNDLQGSFADGRVDWVCAEGTRENLRDILLLEKKGELLERMEEVAKGDRLPKELLPYIEIMRKQ